MIVEMVMVQCDDCGKRSNQTALAAWRARDKAAQIGWGRDENGHDFCPVCWIGKETARRRQGAKR